MGGGGGGKKKKNPYASRYPLITFVSVSQRRLKKKEREREANIVQQ